jgi:hypothetical protein
MKDSAFSGDTMPLLAKPDLYNNEFAYKLILSKIASQLSGASWKGIEENI